MRPRRGGELSVAEMGTATASMAIRPASFETLGWLDGDPRRARIRLPC